MPSLRRITCQVLWPEGTAFKEYATSYGDGIVETFIAVPSDKPQRFSIRVTSKGYIYEGLTAVVFIDGVYQCNRNRINLVRPKQNQPPERSEIDFCMRQEERNLKDEGYFLGSDWRFDHLNTVSEEPKESFKDQFRNLGEIDIIILRCSARKSDDTAEDDYDSAAESDVLGNKLTEDDDEDRNTTKKGGNNNNNNNKGGNNNDNNKNANNQKKGNQKGGGKDNGKDGMNDEDAGNNQVDGPADGYYDRPSYHRGTSWAQPLNFGSHLYGTPPSGRGPRHVHFDMPSDGYRPHENGYSGHHEYASARAHPFGGPSHYPQTPHRPVHEYGFNRGAYSHPPPPPPPPPPAPHTPPHQGRPGYNGMHNTRWPQSPYPFQQPTEPSPPAWQSASQHPRSAHQEPPQPTLNWVQPQAPKKDEQAGNNDTTTSQAQQAATSQPTTIDPYSGYYWDTTGWKPAIVGVSKESMAGNSTSGQNGSGQTNDDAWGNTGNTNDTNAWTNDEVKDNNNDQGWGNNNNDSNNDSNNTATPDWNNNNNDDTNNDHNNNGGTDDWNKPSGGTDDWNNNNNNNTPNNGGWDDGNKNDSNSNNGNNNTSSSPPPTTLHGPHGAYHGPRIAVQPNGDTPWVSDEPPRYDVPTSIIAHKNLSTKQVQRGKAYNYYKRHRKPIYIDSIEEPYARFVFKYRTKDKLPKGLNLEEGFEPSPDQATQDLQDKKKEELIEELLRFRMAYGAEVPAAPVTVKKDDGKGENDATPCEAEKPANEFLRYSLPVHYGDVVTGGGGNAGSNGNGQGNGNGNSSWDTSGGGSKPADNDAGWDTGDKGKSNGGENGWSTTPSGNNGGGDNGWDTGGGGGNSGTKW